MIPVKYIMTSFDFIKGIQINIGDEFSFDGTYINFDNGNSFLGFVDRDEAFHVYCNDSCSYDIKLASSLKNLPGIGSKILSISGMKDGSDYVTIVTSDGAIELFHDTHCCEIINLLDVSGDPLSMVGETITVFEVRIGTIHGGKRQRDDRIYTFYELQTARHDVTMRWGEPDNEDNGRYGEEITVKWRPNR